MHAPIAVYISAAVILLALAFLVDSRRRYQEFMNDPECVDKMIDSVIKQLEKGGLTALTTYPVRIQLELNRKPAFEQMRQKGMSYFDLRKTILEEALAAAHNVSKKLGETIKKPDPRNLMDEDPELEKYEQLIHERSWTPRGIIAAHFEIVWSDLKVVEFENGAYVTEVNSGHTWKVPFKEFGANSIEFRIMEIDENMRPVATHFLNLDDINEDIRCNGYYITEMAISRSVGTSFLF
jgi:hypothetical protein